MSKLDRSYRDDFNRAAAKPQPKRYDKPEPTLEYRPDGWVVRMVHRELDTRARAANAQTRQPPERAQKQPELGRSFSRAARGGLAKAQFNRAAEKEKDQGRGR